MDKFYMREIIASELGLPFKKEIMEQLTNDVVKYDALYEKTFQLPKDEVLKMATELLSRVKSDQQCYQMANEKLNNWVEHSNFATREDPFATIATRQKKIKK